MLDRVRLGQGWSFIRLSSQRLNKNKTSSAILGSGKK